MSTTLGALLDGAARRFREAGFETPKFEARMLLAALLNEAPGALFSREAESAEAAVAERFEGFVRRRLAHEPSAYIAGKRGFRDLDLGVGPGVLIPRPETELLVEVALGAIAGLPRPHILDLGTGPGTILLALLAERPDADGVGTDVSETALTYARHNAASHGLGHRAAFMISSWWSHVPGRFDLVVANPPYIRSADLAGLMPEVRDHEPHLALDGGPDGLGPYRAIASGAAARLEPGGTVVVEIGQGQGGNVSALFAGAGFAAPARHRDLAGLERVLAFTLP